MRRWHTEVELMSRRWRKELATHARHPNSWKGSYPYEALAPASIACDVECHCANGMGTMRKQKLSGHHKACHMCNWEKYQPKDRLNKRTKSIEFEFVSYEEKGGE